MKACWPKLLLIIFALSVPVCAGTIETADFDIERLRIDAVEKSIIYGDLETIRDAGYPTVPFQRHHLSSQGKVFDTDISAVVVSADTIDPGFRPFTNTPDFITADFDIQVVQPAALEHGNQIYPDRPFKIYSQISGDKTIWSVMVFPVQYLDDGRIIFNRQVEIRVNDESEGMISRGLGDDMQAQEPGPTYMKPSMATDENGCPLGCQYIVVTSPELREAFEEFIHLKIQTGFDAAIAITDSIFANYGGIDQAEALRDYLKDFYNTGGEYVLLGGDEHHVPIRYAFYYNTEEAVGLEELLICDLYFADYDGNWDADGDGVWGEPTADWPDLGAEVALGRLPFSEPAQVTAYTKKLRNYIFNPGGGNREYLNRSVFFTSDQMLDYFGEQGQQHYVAEKFPAYMDVNSDQLAESPTGNAPTPTGPFPPEAVTGLDNGYGMVNILAHGRPDGFILNSHEYNLFPKSYLLTGDEHIGNGAFDDLAASEKISFYYSISCSQASIDLETVYDMAVPSVVEKLLEIDSAGAVGIIAFSRWGWVGSSYRIMASFYEHFFGEADGYPVEAMYRTYVDYPYYTDQIYGQNYYGDPSLQVYRGVPSEIGLTAPDFYDPIDPLNCRLTIGGEPWGGQPVMVKIGNEYKSVITDAEGYLTLQLPLECTEVIEVTAYVPGVIAASALIYPSIAADADDDDLPLPARFELFQNYPNPFNPATTISFNLTRHQEVSLHVYDILGRLIDRPVDGYLAAGEHKVLWSGTDAEGNEVASGMYFYRLVSAEGTAVKKMVLVR